MLDGYSGEQAGDRSAHRDFEIFFPREKINHVENYLFVSDYNNLYYILTDFVHWKLKSFVID